MPKKRKAESSSEESESEEESSEWNSEQSGDDEEDEDESESEEEEISNMQVLQNKLRKVIYKWCMKVRQNKEVPKNIKEGGKLREFVYEKLDSCLDLAEKKLDFKKHGLFEANYFIRHNMQVGLTCDLRKIDKNQPNICGICKKESKVLKQDCSNYSEVVSECSGMTMDENGFRAQCTNYHCYGCSGMPEPYDPDAKERWCKHCNTPEKIAESLELAKTTICIWSKDKEKAPVKEVDKDVVNVFGGGRGNVTLKHAKKLFKLPEHKTPTFEQMNRAGYVEKDDSGNFDVHRKVYVPRPEKEKEVLVRFVIGYNTKYSAITEMKGKKVKVNYILGLINKISISVKANMNSANEAIGALQRLEPVIAKKKKKLVKQWKTKIEEELDELPLNTSMKKRKKKEKELKAKGNKQILAELSKMERIVTDDLKIEMAKQLHAMNLMKEGLNDIGELLRIVKNEIDKNTFKDIETILNGGWEFFKCDFIKEEKEVTDDEPEDKDDENANMYNEADDNVVED